MDFGSEASLTGWCEPDQHKEAMRTAMSVYAVFKAPCHRAAQHAELSALHHMQGDSKIQTIECLRPSQQQRTLTCPAPLSVDK